MDDTGTYINMADGEEENLYTFDYEAVYNFNDSLDYKNIPYFGVIKKLPLYEIVLKSYVYAMIIFFSLVGNALIIVVVLRHKQMRTTTNYYIVNLAVADILVTVFCTWVHLVNNLNNNNWVLGGFFCKFNTFSQGKGNRNGQRTHSNKFLFDLNASLYKLLVLLFIENPHKKTRKPTQT